MKVKNYPCLLTDEELKAEIERLDGKIANWTGRRALRLFDLRRELKRRQQITPKTEADL